MTDAEFKEAWEVLASPALKQLVVKLRYMGNQYAAGQVSRGGSPQKHYLQEAADELERLFAESVEHGQEVADLRNVVQATCVGGLPSMARTWAKYFPEHPITIQPEAYAAGVAQPLAAEEKRLWLWKNFVGGKPEYWAFDNPYPCVTVGGDPLTLGEPCGWALLKASVNGRPNRSEQEVIEGAIRRAARGVSANGHQDPIASDSDGLGKETK